MDLCPVFLKKDKRGVTLIEVMIVVVFLAMMAVIILVALQPSTQMDKSRDAKRKADLQKLKNPLEDYYNDNKCYPPSLNDLVPDYIGAVPKDPATGQPYTYAAEGCSKYRVYTILEFEKDPVITEVGCQEGCGPGGLGNYNYGVSSSNTGLEKTVCTQDWWACQGPVAGPLACNNYGMSRPSCSSGGQPYCGDDSCGGGCGSQTPCSP